jgi:mono/diheme cytochrome c family protein
VPEIGPSKELVMGRKRYVVGPVLLAGSACNSAPPVPENPIPFGAPDFGATTIQDVGPPPISGGTMLLSRDGNTAIVADLDRDFVSFVDLGASAVRARADLSPGDEPGRLAEDSGGLVYVALRGSGELATLSVATGQLLDRRPVCAQPRGVAYDAKTDQVIVACATGELVTLPVASGPAVQTRLIEPDLRDVVIDGDSIFVSKFRAAEVLRLTRSGDIAQRATLPHSVGRSPAQAWRMRGTPDHGLVVSYQDDSTSFIPTTPGGYGGGSSRVGPGVSGGGVGLSGAIVGTAVATLSGVDMTAVPQAGPTGTTVLSVDIAVSPSGGNAVLVGAGNYKSSVLPQYSGLPLRSGGSSSPAAQIDGQLVAVEIRPDATIVLQSREPARLYVVSPGGQGQADKILSTITLSDASREDTGHTIFHTNSGGSVACASCHGEGGDDAQTWNFDGTKARRTPSLLGTVKGTAPYHWDGDFPDLQSLSHEVYTRRMGGRLLASDQVAALRGWLEQLPAPKRPGVDSAARARGQALFQGKGTCSSCHSGPSYTNNATVDVGTGGPLQVPPLVGVGARAPLLHAGCAKTLTERFTVCATSGHGQTLNLTTVEISDLVTFLNSL